jgi:hypothetical protein
MALVRPVRRALIRVSRLSWLLVRMPERRYAKWFIKTYGRHENPYLDSTEHLGVRRTYVSLYFRGSAQDPEARIPAIDAIAAVAQGYKREASDDRVRNIVIEGEPGSGKSTLLRAYGAALLRHQTGVVPVAITSKKREIPFFISLRKLAAALDNNNSRAGDLAEYLIREVLVAGTSMTARAAEEFFDYVLGSGRCLVLLDGIDEVTTERYENVKAAVYQFVENHNPARPTHTARVILTCRRQNLLSIRDEWVGPVADQAFRLAPWRTSEIINYLDNVRDQFRTPDGPEEFIAAVRSSGTFELHRTPLVLAMSVGLFIRKVRYEIPHSISELYELMVAEMLDRHRFKGDQSSNKFRVRDKYRALREYAFYAAQGTIGFDEFTRRDLVDFVRPLARQLEAVPVSKVDPFVDEIIDRSGLLSDVSDSNDYVFAHRSIQEHLAAEELRLRGAQGTDFLLAHAAEQEWRQVVLFVAAAQDQRLVGPMLERLAEINLPLASHCLAVADVADEVAERIILKMATRAQDTEELTENLAALLAATGSPRVSVQEFAVNVVSKVLTDLIERRDLVTTLGGNTAAVIRVLATLANADAVAVTALVPTLAAAIPDDPRLVEPLWRCLNTPGLDKETAKVVINRLVGLAMDPECFVELQLQDPISRSFLTTELRHHAYPFAKGWPSTSNLVTLLAWADFLSVAPARTNRFLQAKQEGRLATVERDRSRTIEFRPFWPIRVISVIFILAAVAGSSVVLVTDVQLLLRPYGWWTLLIILGCSLIPSITMSVATDFIDIDIESDAACAMGPIMEYFNDYFIFVSDWPYYLIAWLPVLAYSVALVPLLSTDILVYAILSIIVVLLHFGSMADRVSRDKNYHLWQPNPYIDMYHEPTSQLWLAPPPSDTLGPSRRSAARGRK